MKTQVMQGYFKVRDFGTNAMRKETDVIKFNKVWDNKEDIPSELISRVNEFKNKKEETRFAVEFKIAKSAHWFDKYGKPCGKPTNEELDGKRYEVVIDFRDVIPETKKNPKTGMFNADGFYVNNIMFKLVEDNPFAGMAFEVGGQGPAESAPAPEEPKADATTNEPELPF